MRLQFWETRLSSYIESMRKVEFVWGETDCCNFTSGAIEAITGERITFPILDSALTANRYIKESGGIESVVGEYLTEKDVLYASRGDVVSAEINDDICIGVCMGDSLVFKTLDGIAVHPISSIRKAWGID